TAASRAGFERNAFGLFESFDFYFFGSPVHHFFQIQFDTNAQIRTFHSAWAALLAETATEMPTENITEMRENVFHIHSAAAKPSGSAYARMAKLVIARFFLRITQNFISF